MVGTMEIVKDEARRAEALFDENMEGVTIRANRMFVRLMLLQWLFGVLCAVWLSPQTWAGPISRVHAHVYAAVVLGALLTGLPVFLVLRRPNCVLTRHAIAVCQMLTSALLIHLTGGRIETHFHIFGSLALLAFYRDWKVLVTATVVVAADHALRGFYWPQSVYGVAMIQPARFLEHAGWVLFENAFLIQSIRESLKEMREIVARRAKLESINRTIELTVSERTRQLTQSLSELKEAGEQVRVSETRRKQSEKLSAVGQLAAGVAHEINNPLAVILGFAQGMARQLKAEDALELPIKSIEREALRCKALVQNLLTFARTSQSERAAMDLNQVVELALALIEPQAKMGRVKISAALAGGLPPILGNRNQIEQVIMNLAKNALDAMPNGGSLTLTSELLEQAPHSWVCLRFVDDGTGIPPAVVSKIFDPFFTTKPIGQGTGRV